jgi:fibronectin type 3 domain-containing protein
MKPDILKPVEPLFAGYKVNEQEVILQLVPSSSKDVKEHRLMRRESGTEAWSEISKWQKPEVKKEYRDNSVKGAAYYQYTLVAVDSAGNVSDMAPTVDVRVVPKVSKEEIKNASASYNKEKKMVELAWSKPDAQVDYYIIYRGKDGKRPLSLTTTDGNMLRFEDSSYTGKGKYSYMIKAMYKDLGESPFTVLKDVIVD